MNTNNAVLSRQIRGRSRPFRSLLVATAASLVLTGFILPRADATVISYFNFEDSRIVKAPPSNFLDVVPDFVPGNPGGGAELSTSNLVINDAADTSAIGVNAF